MKKSLFALLYICVLLCVVSCRTQKQPIITATEQVRVETKIERVLVTDTVYIELPHQSVERTTLDTISFLELDYAKSLARINHDGTLFHNLEMKPQTIPAEVQTQIIYRDSIAEREKEIKVPQPYPVYTERELTSWQKLQMRGFWILLATLLSLVAWKWRKPLLVLIRKVISQN